MGFMPRWCGAKAVILLCLLLGSREEMVVLEIRGIQRWAGKSPHRTEEDFIQGGDCLPRGRLAAGENEILVA